MYTKDKSQRITLRLNDEQFNFVKRSSDALGKSPSDFLRMVVNLTMAADKYSDQLLEEKREEVSVKIAEEGLRRENEETYNNNLV